MHHLVSPFSRDWLQHILYAVCLLISQHYSCMSCLLEEACIARLSHKKATAAWPPFTLLEWWQLLGDSGRRPKLVTSRPVTPSLKSHHLPGYVQFPNRQLLRQRASYKQPLWTPPVFQLWQNLAMLVLSLNPQYILLSHQRSGKQAYTQIPTCPRDVWQDTLLTTHN